MMPAAKSPYWNHGGKAQEPTPKCFVQTIDRPASWAQSRYTNSTTAWTP